ncbi:type II/IV secretion system protein [Flavobacteriaceae bacterium TP-CH-4]|uniref:Type II/IV secretion system protein n=1 Tax=Pelagihabitans pacificus TaxID=2696054 RepID=A0A967EA17_9FLAO|nr:GspE/PulE family protein [Pelagihabitans pacificus]NHF58996.1 type II/IV secretion system protein [Pelagihabitans pacificus]
MISEITLTVEEQQVINSDLAHNYGIIPKEMDEFVIGFFVDESKLFETLPDELELILGKKVKLFPAPAEKVAKALSQYYRRGRGSTTDLETGKNFNISSQDFLQDLIFEAKAIGSSDIHFEVFKADARIRYRIDGKLIEKYKIEKENYLELVNKIKIKSNLDITEKRLPQDGRINYDDFDIRVSILPTLHGEKIVMRILGRDTDHLSIDKLGMAEDEKRLYLEALKSSKGIILISGPTGSGKTTTLYSSLKLLNDIRTNIVTVEDPIEYTLKGINQVQLREDIGLTFTSALRTFLRQDPDIIMLGEIRDGATAEMAIRASLTGHLVLSTIHTNSALGTISRLVDMGIPAFLIAETLKISVAQRLVRKLCNNCKQTHETVKEEYEHEAFKSIARHYSPIGCENCFYTGYSGRTAIYEVIPIDASLAQEIKKSASHLESFISEKNVSRLFDKAIELVKNGTTSIEEVYSIIIEAQ